MKPLDLRDERGVMAVLFAVVLTVILMVTAVVWDAGNWWTHRKHLQTKADAAAFAGGDTWGFPCGADSDARIVAEARKYVGAHMGPGNQDFTGVTTFNPQIGGTPGENIHVVLNGADWWDDDAGFDPADLTLHAGTTVCEAKFLDVKATEENNLPLFGLIPFFPDIKRRARIQIEESAGVTGLLPIAVRIPRPLSAAAVFYNEDGDEILDVKYFRPVCIPSVPQCVFGAPAGLGQWTTEPAPGAPGGSLAEFQVAGTTGVAIATSFRAACNVPGATAPCLDDAWAPGDTATDFCRQNATIRCFDATGGGTSQIVESGVHFIRGYGSEPTGTGPPQLRNAYFNNPSTGCYAYFNSVPSQCTNQLNVQIDLGALNGSYPNPPGPPPGPLTPGPLQAGDVQVRYRIERADGTSDCDNYGAQCDLLPSDSTSTGTVTFSTTGAGSAPHPPLTVGSQGNAVSIEVRVRNTTNLTGGNCGGYGVTGCRWFYTANSIDRNNVPTPTDVLNAPIQRSFMGDLDRTGPLRWLRVTRDIDCDVNTIDRIVGWDPIAGEDAASQPASANRCFIMDMGLQGGMARDQDEPPIALLLGSGPSQRALVDCDPSIPFGQVDDEIRLGCQWPPYTGNKFDAFPNDCPWSDDTPGTFFDLPKPAPSDDWEPFDCVLTRTTGSASQIEQGFNKRFFTNAPYNCPTDDGSPYQRGRNYWHRANNDDDMHTFKWDGDGDPALDHGTNFHPDDPRAVTLFFTPYGSFTGTGTQVQELVGLGSFYITGYGKFTGSGLQIDDPCADGAGGGTSGYNFAGNDPPPDINGSSGQRVVWGHFIKDAPGGGTGGTGVICEPQLSFNPCVPVLVE
jgi:hypothetical protein